MKPTNPINITPMTPLEARECTELIRKDLAVIESMRMRLLDMERRQGFKALGYSSWREWATKEYSSQSQAYLYRLLGSAKVEENLAQDSTISTIVETEIPVTQLSELAKLPPEQQPEALKLAEVIAKAKGKKRTAAHVAKAVRSIKQPTSVAIGTAALGESLGLPTRGDSTLPESDHIDDLTHTSPVDVDDRPGAAPPPSPWALRAEFPITVGDCSTVQVKFIPSGMMHRFEFRGAISETGYYCEFIPAQTAQGYRSPKECATALANDFHTQWMKAKTKPHLSGTAAGNMLVEPATAAQPTEKFVAEVSDNGAIAQTAPSDLTEVTSTADIDTLIDLCGTTAVCRMFVAASPEVQQIVRGYYPGIGALVTSELGGSEFNKIANQAGFLPNHEPDAVRVDMLTQENARLDEALRLCEESAQRLERENGELHRKLDELLQALKDAQAEIAHLKGELAAASLNP